MQTKIYAATLLLGCGLGFNFAPSPARAEEQQKPAVQEPAKKPHRVQGDIPFSYSYSETLNLARKNGRPIFAYFTFET